MLVSDCEGDSGDTLYILATLAPCFQYLTREAWNVFSVKPVVLMEAVCHQTSEDKHMPDFAHKGNVSDIEVCTM